MDKQERVITIATVALLVLVAVIVVLVCGLHTNWFRTNFEYIYLEANGERLQQSEEYRLGDVQLNVKQFGFKPGYTVKVYANSTEDFTFTVDGKYYNFLDEVQGKDLAAAFNIRSGKRSFLLHARDILITDVLQALYPDSEVELVSEPGETVRFKLVVTDQAGKHSFELNFHCRLSVTDIEVDPDHVYAKGVLPCVS